MERHDTIETEKLIEFASAEDVGSWRPVHDGVMGGVSRGRASYLDGFARFSGDVSLVNNGGFASFRRSVRLPDLSGYEGLRLRVRGDGQTYRLSLRTSASRDGVGWQASFETVAGEWTTIDLEFESLVPRWRGRRVEGADPFEPASIREVGVLIADQQAGPFLLDLRAIEAWRRLPSSN